MAEGRGLRSRLGRSPSLDAYGRSKIFFPCGRVLAQPFRRPHRGPCSRAADGALPDARASPCGAPDRFGDRAIALHACSGARQSYQRRAARRRHLAQIELRNRRPGRDGRSRQAAFRRRAEELQRKGAGGRRRAGLLRRPRRSGRQREFPRADRRQSQQAV